MNPKLTASEDAGLWMEWESTEEQLDRLADVDDPEEAWVLAQEIMRTRENIVGELLRIRARRELDPEIAIRIGLSHMGVDVDLQTASGHLVECGLQEIGKQRR